MSKEIKYPNLLAEMAKHGETGRKLSLLLNITEAQFSRKINGLTKWNLKEVDKLLEHYKKTYEELFKR